jgi:hypothetical protein
MQVSYQEVGTKATKKVKTQWDSGGLHTVYSPFPLKRLDK